MVKPSPFNFLIFFYSTLFFFLLQHVLPHTESNFLTPNPRELSELREREERCRHGQIFEAKQGRDPPSGSLRRSQGSCSSFRILCHALHSRHRSRGHHPDLLTSKEKKVTALKETKKRFEERFKIGKNSGLNVDLTGRRSEVTLQLRIEIPVFWLGSSWPSKISVFESILHSEVNFSINFTFGSALVPNFFDFSKIGAFHCSNSSDSALNLHKAWVFQLQFSFFASGYSIFSLQSPRTQAGEAAKHRRPQGL
ncbi:uncharacterized protein LOC133726316 [Rosa rugosa]|uniref:uncharacterized protein LOC133726316 n=1 Tax=Rosa rugosa TaxID=74645 RepID=UPI002B412781|nr:uncharacterized protein LOC133726316 [Rosa rugosa]